MINTILFDLDGTILNTLSDITNALNHTLKHFNYETRTEKEVRSFLGNGARVLVTKALGDNLERLDEVLAFYLNYYEANSESLTKPYEGISELLSELKGNYKLGVVSNKHQEAVVKIINKIFPNTFDIIMGETANIAKKPAPDMIYHAIDTLQTTKDKTLFIGDSEVDILTAQRAGVDVIGVTWGFRDKEELIEAMPNYLIDEVSDIKILLKGMKLNVTD